MARWRLPPFFVVFDGIPSLFLSLIFSKAYRAMALPRAPQGRCRAAPMAWREAPRCATVAELQFFESGSARLNAGGRSPLPRGTALIGRENDRRRVAAMTGRAVAPLVRTRVARAP